MVVEPGSISVLLGANGAGKTTLLEGLSGVMRLDGGAIELHGEAIQSLRPDARARKGLAHVEQGRTVFRLLTTDENLRVAARGAGVDEAYALFPELEKRTDVRAGLLSGGEQQMLVIARALLDAAEDASDRRDVGWPCARHRGAPDDGGAPARRAGAGGPAGRAIRSACASIGDRAYVMRRGQVVYDGPCPALAKSQDLLHRLYLGESAT